MKSMAVVDFAGPKHGYAEAVHPGTTPMSMAIMDPEKKQLLCNPFVCKDFVQDAFHSEHLKHPETIWGFSWSPGMLSLDLPEYAFSVDLLKPDLVKKADRIQSLLNAFEGKMGYDKSTLFKDENKANRFALYVDREWVQQPLRVSCLLLLVRVGTAYNGGKIEDFIKNIDPAQCLDPQDGKYVQTISANLLDILKKKEWPKQTYEQYPSSHGVHHSGGIVAFITGKATG